MRTSSTILGFAIAAATAVAVGPPVPAEYVGSWSPDGTCKGPLQVKIAADSITLVNGSDSQKFGDVDMCLTCAGGFQYEGPVIWLVGDWRDGAAGGGVEHFTIYLNQPAVGRAQVEVTRPELKKRFPFAGVATLDKCK